MRDVSSDSVRTFFADRERVVRELRKWVAGLKRRRPDVEKVGLFGSYATDTYGVRSDADLLIVLRDSDRAFRDRISDLLPDGVSVPCDVFPYTATELERLGAEGSPWINHILEEVVWF